VGRVSKVQGPELQTKKIKNNFPVTMKIGTSRYQRLECFIATLPTQGVYGRLVHVDETFNRFADFGQGKERGGRGRLGYLSRAPEFLVTLLLVITVIIIISFIFLHNVNKHMPLKLGESFHVFAYNRPITQTTLLDSPGTLVFWCQRWVSAVYRKPNILHGTRLSL